MHITPPVTAEGFDGSNHPRYAECSLIQTRFDVGTESANTLGVHFETVPNSKKAADDN